MSPAQDLPPDLLPVLVGKDAFLYAFGQIPESEKCIARAEIELEELSVITNQFLNNMQIDLVPILELKMLSFSNEVFIVVRNNDHYPT